MFEPTTVAMRRKIYLALAKRRTRPGSGSSRRHLQRRTANQPTADLQALLQGAPFVVVGAMAARLYMPERMTQDIDVLVLVDDLAACEQRLLQAGCRKIGDLSIGGASWELPDGAELDVIVSGSLWAHRAVAEPVMADTGLPTISLPYLVVMKLLSGRAQDIADLTRMLGAADDVELEQVRTAVAEYVPDAVDDVESMVVLGRMEYES